jgi:hypothetical protein
MQLNLECGVSPVCCRYVADMLPIFLAKLLNDNNVADVADFPTRNAIRPGFQVSH